MGDLLGLADLKDYEVDLNIFWREIINLIFNFHLLFFSIILLEKILTEATNLQQVARPRTPLTKGERPYM